MIQPSYKSWYPILQKLIAQVESGQPLSHADLLAQLDQLKQVVLAMEDRQLTLKKLSKHSEDATALFAQLFENAPNAYVLLDSQLKMIDANLYAREMLHYTPKDRYKPFSSYLISGLSNFFNWIDEVPNKLPLEVELFHYNKDGRVELFHNPLKFHDQTFHLISFIRKTQSWQFNQSLYLYKLAFDSVREGIIITDQFRKIIDVNPAFSEITGYGRGEAIGRSPKFLSDSPENDDLWHEIFEHLAERDYWKGLVYNKTKDGRVFPEELKITAVHSQNNEAKPDYYIGIFENISERLSAENELKKMAETDPLTQLYNRAGIQQTLMNAFQRAQRTGESLSLFYLDLDKFKNLNDSLGHKYGDELLKAFSKRLTSHLRKQDSIGRIGGDEFVILIEQQMSEAALLHLADKLIEALKQPYHLIDMRYQCTVSIGIARYPDDAITIEGLFKAADAAMYQAKEAGRNRCYLYNEQQHLLLTQKNGLLSDIQQGIFDHQFKLHYQPQHNLKTGDLIGFEALCRWEKETGQVLPPDQWLTEIEKDPLMIPLGNQLLSQAFQQLTVWLEHGFHWPISINISITQLKSNQFFDHLYGLVAQYPKTAALIHFEIVETVFFESNPSIIEKIERLSKLGFKLILDDFGTGHSSIYSLKKFSFSKIKIDKSFILDIGSEQNDNILLLDGIIDLLQALQLPFICEGVETQQQIDYLVERQCQAGQGYFYSRAMPKIDVLKYARPYLTANDI